MLLDRNGDAADPWTRSDGGAVGNTPHVLVPLEALDQVLAERTADQAVGVFVPNTLRIDEIEAALPSLALVAISFPTYSDGRGFSIARLLRRHGFRGTLRASGPLIPDQFAYALACGFDEIELPEASAQRQPEAQWQQARDDFSSTYQRGYATSPTILDRRRSRSVEHGAD